MVLTAAPIPRRRALHAADGLDATLTYYPPGHRMDWHDHERDQYSLLLTGAIEEETRSRRLDAAQMDAGFKRAGLRHANVYGPQGALILAFNVVKPANDMADWRWRRLRHGAPLAELVSVIAAGGAAREDAVWDVFALLQAPAAAGRGDANAPAWLRSVQEAVQDDPAGADVSGLARAAGVHRVHLSRRYAETFGAPLTVHRRRAMLARAVRAMIADGAGPAAASQIGGFSDQPHFTRTLKRETGLTPARLLTVLG